MDELEGALEPAMIKFVRRHVTSLLTWDILVFFHRNPDAVLDVQGLASRLGRPVPEVTLEVSTLCESRILQCAGGLIRYRPNSDLRTQVGEFVDACQDRSRRLALISTVLKGLEPNGSEGY